MDYSVKKFGLKLWSTNTNYAEEIERLTSSNTIDYIELYTVPDSDSNIEFWKTIQIPFIIHCAHSMHGFNLSVRESEERSGRLFDSALRSYTGLRAHYLIIHPGVGGTAAETIRQLSKLLENRIDIEPRRILVENKPLRTLTDDSSVGADPDEIALIVGKTAAGFCLDVTHAIKFALASARDWVTVLERFMLLAPSVIHLGDGSMERMKDEHLHIGSGNFDFKKIAALCDAGYITVETEKDGRDSLADFEADIDKVKKFFHVSKSP